MKLGFQPDEPYRRELSNLQVEVYSHTCGELALVNFQTESRCIRDAGAAVQYLISLCNEHRAEERVVFSSIEISDSPPNSYRCLPNPHS